MKTCSRCKQIKPTSEFNKKRSNKDGLNCHCKTCSRELINAHYLKNKKYYVSKAERIRKNNADMVRRMKESTPCADCGLYYPYYVMDFDHRGNKKFVLAHSYKTGRTKILEEIDKCDIVCSNCHRIRTHNRRLPT